jgi:hypothetical protein
VVERVLDRGVKVERRRCGRRRHRRDEQGERGQRDADDRA